MNENKPSVSVIQDGSKRFVMRRIEATRTRPISVGVMRDFRKTGRHGQQFFIADWQEEALLKTKPFIIFLLMGELK